MSTTDPARSQVSQPQYPRAAGAQSDDYASADTGSGWVLFAGVMLAMLATLNVIEGIAAVSNSTFFVANAKFIISGLNTWGWIMIFWGVAQGLVAAGVWAQVKSIRWFGVAIAAGNALVQLAFIRAYPFWSLCLFTLDILVIYGLVVHGKRTKA
jgi:hypothetical protein